MKKFLILQLRPEDDIWQQEYEAILNFGKLHPEQTERIRVEQQAIPEINFDDCYGIIVGGSPFDISLPEDQKSDVQKRIEADFKKLVPQIIERDFPFLGVCSGVGIMGSNCGVNISVKYGEAIAWTDLDVTEEGRVDPILAGVPDTFRGLVGHKEACDTLPEGAVLLVTNDSCPMQMFRIGKNIYATQFHPEADGEVFAQRVDAYKYKGYFSPERAAEIMAQVRSEDPFDVHRVLENFVRMYLK